MKKRAFVLSRRTGHGQVRGVLKSSGSKLGMVLFGLFALFFVGYLMWTLLFSPVKPPEEQQTVTRPQMRLTVPKAPAVEKEDTQGQESDGDSRGAMPPPPPARRGPIKPLVKPPVLDLPPR